jgi:hypothetical protein
VLGDGRYRGITSITTPRRDKTGRIIHDDHYRVHPRIRVRVQHLITRLKDRQTTMAMPPPKRRHQPHLHITAEL